MGEWFGTWFDSEFYHILYKDRDHTEAEAFITTLIEYLSPDSDALIHDLACGKGRHSIQLNKLGFRVEGSDYSENSIQFAKQFENDRLHFFHHDMRESLPRKYDYIFNLFTSFGYFETDEEHFETLGHIYHGLMPRGVFVFDYMNVDFVLKNLVRYEEKEKNGIVFQISKRLHKGKIVKDIRFEYKSIPYHFTEQVAALKAPTLTQMLHDCGFKTKAVFGDYHLEPFDQQNSTRLIMLMTK